MQVDGRAGRAPEDGDDRRRGGAAPLVRAPRRGYLKAHRTASTLAPPDDRVLVAQNQLLHGFEGLHDKTGKGGSGRVCGKAWNTQDAQVSLRLRNVDRKDGQAVVLALGKPDGKRQDGKGICLGHVVDHRQQRPARLADVQLD